MPFGFRSPCNNWFQSLSYSLLILLNSKKPSVIFWEICPDNLSGVKIPENIMDSVANGETVEEFAVKELEARNQAVTSKPNDDLGGLQNVIQTPEKPKNEQDNAEKKTEDAVDAFLNMEAK